MEKENKKIKYICPMGCPDPQDQPGNCLECGMKLIPTDERRLQRGSTRMMDYADKRGLSNTQIHADNKYQRESAYENNISVDPRNNDPRKSAYESNNISVDPRNKYPRESALLQLAASLNQFSQHFVAQGILEKAKEEKIEILKVEDFENLPGKGVKGKINNKIYYLGGENLLKSFNLTPPKIETIGTTTYLVDENKNILGAIILEDEIREESFSVIKELHKLKVKTAMITGDKKEVAEKVSQELGIDEYFAEVLPQEKLEKVKDLQKRNLKVMFVGDGINDAPALMQADVGVAIGAGTNVAIESAGIILVKNNPLDILKIIKLSRVTFKKMIQNLTWATAYNILTIPLAAGILVKKGITLSPTLAAIFMSSSTIIVAINAIIMRRAKLL